MELFYAERENIHANEIILDEFERKHVLQAFRKSEGDEVFVTDGAGKLFRTRLVREQKPLSLYIIEREEKQRPKPELFLAIGFIRPARLEFVLEKGTELGVSRFCLIRSRYANYFSENTKRFKKILRQALKQSQQYYLPEIITYPSVETFNKSFDATIQKIVAIDASYPILYAQLETISTKPIVFCVGPEGGFSEEEIVYFNTSGFTPVSLGGTRLRAETAAISGISVIHQYIYHKRR